MAASFCGSTVKLYDVQYLVCPSDKYETRNDDNKINFFILIDL